MLTGGPLRLKEGLALLTEGRAGKMLVSGVNRGVELPELLRVAGTAPLSVACCVELGYAADNTAGNADETRAWMAKEGFSSLRLVTANYHMPRSLLEFRRAMPAARIVPHPVLPDSFRRERLVAVARHAPPDRGGVQQVPADPGAHGADAVAARMTPMIWLRSALFNALFFGWTALVLTLSTAAGAGAARRHHVGGAAGSPRGTVDLLKVDRRAALRGARRPGPAATAGHRRVQAPVGLGHVHLLPARARPGLRDEERADGDPDLWLARRASSA